MYAIYETTSSAIEVYLDASAAAERIGMSAKTLSRLFSKADRIFHDRFVITTQVTIIKSKRGKAK